MATTAALTENSRQGINFQIPPCIGPGAALSPNLRPGCGHAYDETAVGLVVYVRNDPVNFIDPDGRLIQGPEGGPPEGYFDNLEYWNWWDPPAAPNGIVDPVDGGPLSGGANGWGPYHRDRFLECRQKAANEGSNRLLPDTKAMDWIMSSYVVVGIDPAVLAAIWAKETGFSTDMIVAKNVDSRSGETRSTDYGPLQINDHYKLNSTDWQNKYNPSAANLREDAFASFIAGARDLMDHGASASDPSISTALLYWHGAKSRDIGDYARKTYDFYSGAASMFECMKKEE
jgi:hypothetical protein